MRSRFTLVELMIVVAIVGILSAVAIPGYRHYQLRAKMAEIPLNVDGLHLVLTAYLQEHESYLVTALHPDATPGKELRSWNGAGTEFEKVGFEPDGDVRASYRMGQFWGDKCGKTQVSCGLGPGVPCHGSAAAEGVGDFDEDGKISCANEVEDNALQWRSDSMTY